MGQQLRYIAIEGPLGVGKTALGSLLAEHLGARFLRETKTNPFLSAFYETDRRNAFQTQLYYLLARYQEQTALLQGDLFSRGGLITSYVFSKDRIYASLVLSKEELILYERVFALLRPRVPMPDLVIYLQARPEVLLGRIRKRGQPAERAITLDYVEEVAKSYSEFFFHWKESPLLVVDTSEVDLTRDSRALEELLAVIGRHKKWGGVQHYIPLGSQR